MRLSPYYIPVGDWRALVDILLAVFDPRLIPSGSRRWPGPGPGSPPAAAGSLGLGVLGAGGGEPGRLLDPGPLPDPAAIHVPGRGLMVVPLARLFDRGRWLRVAGDRAAGDPPLTAQGWPFGPPIAIPPGTCPRSSPTSSRRCSIFPYLLQAEPRRGRPSPTTFPGRSPCSRSAPARSAGLALEPAGPARAGVGPRSASAGPAGRASPSSYPYRSDPRALFYPSLPRLPPGLAPARRRSRAVGTRVAYAGTNLPYYLLGVGLRNEVRYVNVDAHRGWLMHDYHRQARGAASRPGRIPGPPGIGSTPTTTPGWPTCGPRGSSSWSSRAWAGRAGALPDADPERFPIERRWAESHPESFEPLYGVAEGDPKFRIYRVRPERPAGRIGGGRCKGALQCIDRAGGLDSTCGSWPFWMPAIRPAASATASRPGAGRTRARTGGSRRGRAWGRGRTAARPCG